MAAKSKAKSKARKSAKTPSRGKTVKGYFGSAGKKKASRAKAGVAKKSAPRVQSSRGKTSRSGARSDKPAASRPSPSRNRQGGTAAEKLEQLNANIGEQAAKDAAIVPVETIEEDAEDKQEQEEIRGRGKRRRGLDS